MIGIGEHKIAELSRGSREAVKKDEDSAGKSAGKNTGINRDGQNGSGR